MGQPFFMKNEQIYDVGKIQADLEFTVNQWYLDKIKDEFLRL